MKSHARWLAGLLAGFGAVTPVVADPVSSDPVPIRRFDTVRPDGKKVTVVELLPATDLQAPAATSAPAVPAAADPVLSICGPAPAQLWAQVEALGWLYRGSAIPPLVTSGSLSDPIPAGLGQSGTRTLYGNGPSSSEWAGGGRARVGGFLDNAFGWAVGGFYTIPQANTGMLNSHDVAVLARPFFDTASNSASSLLFGAAGAFDGQIGTHTRTTLWGLEANASAALDSAGTNSVFVGYRYLQMTDELVVAGQYTLNAGGLAFINGISLLPGATGLVADRVLTRNEFHGAQIGWQYRGGYGRFGLNLWTSLAAGVGSERITLEGSTQTVDADGTRRSAPAGVSVQLSNAGQFGRDLLTVVPEAGAGLSFAVAPGVSIFGGYDFLYWASVVRAGDQLDHAVDTRQMPSSGNFTGGPGFRPVATLRDTAFWAHGVNIGLRFEY